MDTGHKLDADRTLDTGHQSARGVNNKDMAAECLDAYEVHFEEAFLETARAGGSDFLSRLEEEEFRYLQNQTKMKLLDQTAIQHENSHLP